MVESKTPRGAAAVGETLRRLRLRTGLTQEDLAMRARISARTLRNVESGSLSRPQAASIHRLAAALGVSEAELEELLNGASAAHCGDLDSEPPLRIDVLGPLAVRRGPAAVEVTSAMQRSLLGLLAVQPGQPVGAEEIIDLLWPDDPPRTCRQLVHTYVAQLRQLLEPEHGSGRSAGVLRRVANGYRLDLPPEQSDLVQFTRLARQAGEAWDAGANEAAMQLHREAWSRWRGPVLAGSDARLREHPAAIRAAHERITAVQQWTDAVLITARYEEVLGPLRVLTAEEPLHEGLAARLMLVLCGTGQQAAALALFESVKALLDEHLGVSPGPQLRTAHLRVLRSELPPAARTESRAPATATAGTAGSATPENTPTAQVPAQLPADVAAFTGRTEHLLRLDDLQGAPCGKDDPGALFARPVTIAAVVGMGGVGKTALAVHWAHRIRDRFPDGQLFVNLRGHSVEGPLLPIDALSGFLLAFGIAADQIPQDEAQAAALFRSQTSNKRLLMVLDNAADAEQVRPLLPTGSGSLVLITARERMAGLVARDGAHLLPLDTLEPDEARALLERMLGARRVSAESEAVAELARLCARLPLALRIAAANLVSRPRHRISDHVRALSEGDRLAALAIDGDATTAVRANFALSFNALPAAERRLFRLIGLLPRTDLTAQTTAALADLPVAQAKQLLERLANRHLLDEPHSGRFTMHDLLRLLAAELAEAEENDDARTAALLRVSGHYRTCVNAAADLLYPHLLHLPQDAADQSERVQPFQDSASATTWLDDERANLLALVHHLAQQGHHTETWKLTVPLNGYFLLRRATLDWRVVAEAGARAAAADGAMLARAMTELNLGMVHSMFSPGSVAETHHARAVELAHQAGWLDGEAVALNNLARSSWLAAQLEETVDCLTRALALHRRSGRKAGEAVTLANLAVAHLELARHREHDRAREAGAEAPDAAAGPDSRAQSLRLLYEALDLHQATEDRRNEGDTLRVMAEAHRDLGDYPLALELSEQALAIAHETGDLRYGAAARNTRATVYARLGNATSAFEDHADSLREAFELGDERLRTQILLDLAESHARLGQPDDALLRLHDVLALAHRSGSRLLKRQARRVQDLVHEAQPDLVTAVTIPAPVPASTTASVHDL